MNELKESRKNKRITQNEAAKILGISRRTYQKYESLSTDSKMLKLYVKELNDALFVDEEHGILTFDEIKECVNKVFINYDINFCYLFGSYAKGKANESSDVDLIIDSDITGLDFFGLVEELRTSLHKKVDLLKINQLDGNQMLLREIMKDGVKIYG